MPSARQKPKKQPGHVRDAIFEVLSSKSPMHVRAIEAGVSKILGPTPASSVRSYLLLNTPEHFVREERGVYGIKARPFAGIQEALPVPAFKARSFRYERSELINGNCIDWFRSQKDCTIHAVVTDPPYGLHEYTDEQQEKLRSGRGGVWRIPPSFDGHTRSPLPRFTTLTPAQIEDLRSFFFIWGRAILPKLVPGANVVVASNPLLSFVVSGALADAGLERRGEIIRLVMTMRGGDRPKAAHEEFDEVSVMPRSMWEPWIVFRKPVEGRVQDNLRKWGTGGFRRPSKDKPFGDVIKSAPTNRQERAVANHPSLKPQAFLRRLVRAVLPLGKGVVADPFSGSGSTLAAANYNGYNSIGVEMDRQYFDLACKAIPKLTNLDVRDND